MVPKALADLAGLFRRRFLFNALLPRFVFATVTIAVIIDRASSLWLAANWWTRLDDLTKLVVVLIYAAGIWFLATAVASQWRGIVRLVEGYPVIALADRVHIPVPGREWHRRRMLALRVGPDADAGKAYGIYPRSDAERAILPTRASSRAW